MPKPLPEPLPHASVQALSREMKEVETSKAPKQVEGITTSMFLPMTARSGSVYGMKGGSWWIPSGTRQGSGGTW